jgi:hypothetical protein
VQAIAELGQQAKRRQHRADALRLVPAFDYHQRLIAGERALGAGQYGGFVSLDIDLDQVRGRQSQVVEAAHADRIGRAAIVRVDDARQKAVLFTAQTGLAVPVRQPEIMHRHAPS